MRMSDEEKREHKKRKEREWSQELLKLQHLRLEKLTDTPKDLQRRRESQDLLDTIHDKILSPEFKEWYEATTGAPVDGFIKDVVITQDEFMDHALHRAGLGLMEWTRRMVELVAERNPWRDPEKMQFWMDYLKDCDDAGERRRIMMRFATPRWADRARIMEMYEERDRLTFETGIEHHVDHIVPIVHPEVCGLNYHLNLRVIPAKENQIKSNLFNGIKHSSGRRKRAQAQPAA